MRTRSLLAIGAMIGLTLAQPLRSAGAVAQGGGQPPQPQPPQPVWPGPAGRAGRGGAGDMQRPGGQNQAPRARLEQQIRQRLGQRMRQALALNDAQMTKLTDSNRRYEEKHRVLQDQERDVRMSLREEILRSDTTRGTQMTALLDRYVKNERQRVDLAEQEQKELGAFLTPLQRAKYFGLQETIRNQIQNLRQQGPSQGQGQGQGRGQGRGRGRNGPNGPPDGMGGMGGMRGQPGQPGQPGNGQMPPAQPPVPTKRPPTP